jgi:hypothetical protein
MNPGLRLLQCATPKSLQLIIVEPSLLDVVLRHIIENGISLHRVQRPLTRSQSGDVVCDVTAMMSVLEPVSGYDKFARYCGDPRSESFGAPIIDVANNFHNS